jgi:hypothetical protein
MFEQIIMWAVLALLLLLSLPIGVIQKLVVVVYGLATRVAILALLAAAAYLFYRPEQVPVEVASAVHNNPTLRAILPEPGTPNFGLVAAALLASVLLPLLAVLDICRRRVSYVARTVVTGSVPVASSTAPPAPPVVAPQAESSPAARRADRRVAAAAMAEAATRRSTSTATHPTR